MKQTKRILELLGIASCFGTSVFGIYMLLLILRHGTIRVREG